MGNISSEIRILNRHAWAARWRDRRLSESTARNILSQCSMCDSMEARNASGLAHRTLAWQAKWRGDFDVAMKHCLAAENHLSEANFPAARADTYSLLGVLHYSRHENDLAEEAVDRGFKILTTGDPGALNSRIDLLVTKATIQRYKGQLARSNVTLGAALEISTREELARVEHNVVRCLLADDKPELAIEHAERSLELAKQYENIVILPYVAEVYGDCLRRLGKMDAAEAQFSIGLTQALNDGDRRAKCQILQCNGELELDRGNPVRALDLFRYAADIAERMQYGLRQRRLALCVAAAHEALGNYEEALAAHKHAWEVMQRPGT